MARRKYTEEQIHSILKESEAGGKKAELCRKYGISDQTLYNWKAKYGGMELSDLKKLRQLEDENAKLKRIVADQQLDILGYKTILEKKF